MGGAAAGEGIDHGLKNGLLELMPLRDDPGFTARRIAGEAFETFIGEHYVRRGWAVWYRDQSRTGGGLGIDIVASKDERQAILQCKRWADAREITHEVIELFHRDSQRYCDRRAAAGQGLMDFFQPRSYCVIFATTCALTNEARTCARNHGIIVRENVEFPARPAVEFATAFNAETDATKTITLEESPPQTGSFDPPIPRKLPAWWQRWWAR